MNNQCCVSLLETLRYRIGAGSWTFTDGSTGLRAGIRVSSVGRRGGGRGEGRMRMRERGRRRESEEEDGEDEDATKCDNRMKARKKRRRGE